MESLFSDLVNIIDSENFGIYLSDELQNVAGMDWLGEVVNYSNNCL